MEKRREELIKTRENPDYHRNEFEMVIFEFKRRLSEC